VIVGGHGGREEDGILISCTDKHLDQLGEKSREIWIFNCATSLARLVKGFIMSPTNIVL
jgi:hypothetical protein